MDKIPMTAAGYTLLEQELKHCQQVERPRIIQQITDARSHGDLSENAEYHAAKEAQSHNEGRIAELEDKLARAEVIDVSKLSGDTIKFGATVTLIDEDTDEKKIWQLVGEPEADAKKGKISIASPLARALLGKKKGSNIEVVAPPPPANGPCGATPCAPPTTDTCPPGLVPTFRDKLTCEPPVPTLTCQAGTHPVLGNTVTCVPD